MTPSNSREQTAHATTTYTDARDAFDTWKAAQDAIARRFWSLVEERAFEEAIEALEGDF